MTDESRDRGGIRIVASDTLLGSAFQENADKVYRFIYAKVGSRAVAEDLTSQVFLKAVRWLGDDYSTQSVRSWLYATARTALVDYWREQSQYPSASLDDSMALLFLGGGEQQEVARTRERARRILDALPPREGTVLRLRFLHGYTAADIGRALGIEPGHVRVIQLRALRRAATLEVPEGDGHAGAMHEASTVTVR
jgi:RNA polymerase sigma-70 factor (ECF subfamily)